MAIQQNKDGSFSRWDNNTSEIKRSISLKEKSTIKDTSGTCIILPGEGGFEFDELAKVGFNQPHLMYGFEKDATRSKQLRAKFPQHKIRTGLIQDNILRIFDNHAVSYLHLDYEQALITGTGGMNSYGNIFFKPDPNSNIKFSEIFANDARLRITSCAKARGNPMGAALWVRTVAYYWFLQAAQYHGINKDLYDQVSDIIDYYFYPIESTNFRSLSDYTSKLTTKKSYAHISFAMFLFMYFATPIKLRRNHLLDVSTQDILDYIAYVKTYDEVQNVYNITSEFYKRTDTTKASPMFTGWCDVGADMVPFGEFLTNLTEYIIGQQTECI